MQERVLTWKEAQNAIGCSRCDWVYISELQESASVAKSSLKLTRAKIGRRQNKTMKCARPD